MSVALLLLFSLAKGPCSIVVPMSPGVRERLIAVGIEAPRLCRAERIGNVNQPKATPRAMDDGFCAFAGG
jgi:hypothetical protein